MLCRCLCTANSTTRLTSVFVIGATCGSFPTACPLAGDEHHRGSELRVQSRIERGARNLAREHGAPPETAKKQHNHNALITPNSAQKKNAPRHSHASQEQDMSKATVPASAPQLRTAVSLTLPPPCQPLKARWISSATDDARDGLPP